MVWYFQHKHWSFVWHEYYAFHYMLKSYKLITNSFLISNNIFETKYDYGETVKKLFQIFCDVFKNWAYQKRAKFRCAAWYFNVSDLHLIHDAVDQLLRLNEFRRQRNVGMNYNRKSNCHIHLWMQLCRKIVESSSRQKRRLKHWNKVRSRRQMERNQNGKREIPCLK